MEAGLPQHVSQEEVIGLQLVEDVVDEQQVIIQTSSADGSPVYQTIIQPRVDGQNQIWRVQGSTLNTVQLVHSYNLPPSAEHQNNIASVEDLRVVDITSSTEEALHAAGLEAEAVLHQSSEAHHGETVIEEQLEASENFNINGNNSIISFKKLIFFDNLKEFYNNCEFTDTTVLCSDGSRKIHSFVLGAASSLMRGIFSDINSKIMDSEMTILMPEVTTSELDLALRPIYGFGNLNFGDLLFQENIIGQLIHQLFGIDFNQRNVLVKSEAVKEKHQTEEVTTTQDLFNDNQPVSNYDEAAIGEESEDEDIKPKIKQRKRKRPKKSKYGYLYDDFIDDEDDIESDGEWEVPDAEPKQKRKRGRPKKIKEEEPEKEEDPSIEPIIKVKEEALERTFNEFNEFFSQHEEAAAISDDSQISFNQDDMGVFHCEAVACVFSTLVRASIQQHVRQGHVEGGYKDAGFHCLKCGEAWANEIHFQRHLQSNECIMKQEVPFVCENCGKGWYNLTNYTRHLEARECKTVTEAASGINKHKCINCELAFFSLKNRETHVRKAHMPPAGKQYRCAKCDINFVTHKEFSLHKKSLHNADLQGKPRYNCRIPSCKWGNTATREELAVHVKTKHPDKVHICDNCGRNFPDGEKLTAHITSHGKSGKGRKCLSSNYDCPHCPREFNRKRHMELHVLFKHSQDRPFSCEQCGKKFKTRHCVNIHLRSHGIGGYSWCCEECGKTFNQISAYHVHLKVHSNIREFACEDCGMTFKLKHSLKKHQLVHKAEFGHTCDFCGKKFKRSDNLINHRRRHTGEHPYKCDKCSWTGPDSSSFIHHKKKHTEPVHNLNQEAKHGSFTSVSSSSPSIRVQQQVVGVDQKPQIHLQTIQEVGKAGPINPGQVTLQHLVTSNSVNPATGEIKLEGRGLVTNPSLTSLLHSQGDVKLVQTVNKIQTSGPHSHPM